MYLTWEWIKKKQGSATDDETRVPVKKYTGPISC